MVKTDTLVKTSPPANSPNVDYLVFKKLIENSHEGITLLDKDLQIIYRSRSAERIVGWNSTDRNKSTLAELIHPDDQQLLESKIKEIFSQPGQPVPVTFHAMHSEGRYIWLECIFTNMLDDPDVNAIVCNFRDITEKKEEKNIILESIDDAFFAVDKNWIVTYWNHKAEKVLSTPRKEVFGRNLWDVFGDSINSESYKRYHEAIETNKVVRFEDFYAPLNKWYEISAFPSDNGLSVYFKDITERLRYVKAVEEQNENLKEIAWLQSHVIRAPLARIMGLIHVLKYSKNTDAEAQEAMDYLLESANELDEVIKTITDKTERVG